MTNTRLPNPYEETVSPEWVDYNGHMNVAYYVLVFDHATDHILSALDLGETYRATNNASIFVVESHITYEQEVLKGYKLQVRTLWVEGDDKRLRLFHIMERADTGDRVATIDIMLLHVSLESRRSTAFPNIQISNIKTLHQELQKNGRPQGLDRCIQFPTRKAP